MSGHAELEKEAEIKLSVYIVHATLCAPTLKEKSTHSDISYLGWQAGDKMCVVEAHWPSTRTRRRSQSSEMKTPGAWHIQIHPIRPTTSRLSSFFIKQISDVPCLAWAQRARWLLRPYMIESLQ